MMHTIALTDDVYSLMADAFNTTREDAKRRIYRALYTPSSATESRIPVCDPDHFSPCDRGWDTVIGYMSRYNPEALSLFDPSDAEATLRDGFWLTHRCREQGISPRKVPAPACLRRVGIEAVNSYPVELLAKRLL